MSKSSHEIHSVYSLDSNQESRILQCISSLSYNTFNKWNRKDPTSDSEDELTLLKMKDHSECELIKYGECKSDKEMEKIS